MSHSDLQMDYDSTRVVFPESDPEEELRNTRFKAPLSKTPLGNLLYTAEEFIAIQIAIKIRGNVPDTVFKSQISAITRGLERSDLNLPATRYKADQQLATMAQCKKFIVVYCDDCLEICRTLRQVPKKSLKCPKCKTDLRNLTSQGRSYFIVMSIRKQIEGYLKDKKFLSLLKSSWVTEDSQQNMNGILHRGIMCNGHFDLSFGIDAAQLNKYQGKSILPAVLFFNNVPISWQLRFPILAALWTGPSKEKPPRRLILQHMIAELKELGTTDPILWRDIDGKQHASFVYLTTVISDAPEKAELLNQISHGGYFGCPYCKAEGERITIEKYPHVFNNNPYKRTAADRALKGPRYPKFVHEDKDYKWRESEDRLETGRRVARKKVETSDATYKEEGIKGLPVLRGLPGSFKATESHVADFLHLIAEGVCEDIVDVLVGKGKSGYTGRSLFLQGGRSWKIFDEMQANMSRVSECDRNCQWLHKYPSEWKAYDQWEFLTHNLAQLCSDETIITDTQVYECLVHLANIVYLWHQERITAQTIESVRSEVKNFCKCFKSVFTEEYMTYKAHVLQHIPDFMVLHGSGTFTDAFNLERFISCTKKLMTTTRAHMNQIARNFLLAHQSPVLQCIDSFSEAAKETLRENNVFNEVFFNKFGDTVKTKHHNQTIPEDKKELLHDFIKSSLKKDPNDVCVTRVIQMCRNSIILESEHAKHRSNTAVDDSYIQVDGSVFGRITEIFYLDDTDEFIIILRKYERIYPVMQSGCRQVYPINQIPYQRPAEDDNFIFLLNKNILIQKAKVCRTSYFYAGRKVRLFTVRPNFWFRY